MRLYNSLSRSIEDFIPQKPDQVTIYACGPTVYDFPHIGNLRTFIMSDLLIRSLNLLGFKTKTVRNITDIDDKIIKRAKERQITTEELADEFTRYFEQDLFKLNILPVEVSPKATEHITKMIKFIEILIEKGFAYVEADGSVYFDISKFPNYGKLSQLEKRELKAGTRALSDEYSKDDVQDFALWKATPDEVTSWDSPWGKGRPGWHIECSVMSQVYLGDTLDIHTGAVDLLFPHHENEIAQSEAKTGQQFVKYFVHGEHLLIDSQKMSKSLHNIYTLRDIEAKNIDPLALRYLFMTAHYRDKLNFTWDSLQAAANALKNLENEVRGWSIESVMISESAKQFDTDFFEAINNDLNTPQALAVAWNVIKSDLSTAEKSQLLLKFDQIFGLGLDKIIGQQIDIPESIQKLLTERESARENKDYAKSDQIRDEIAKLGYEILDSTTGSTVRRI